MSEIAVTTIEGLSGILDRVEIANSFTHALPKLGWEIKVVEHVAGYQLGGWLINMTYERPDTFTGELGIGRGRSEFIYHGALESFVVKTAYVLLTMLVTHELMEAFMYEGKRLFNPHHTVGDLGLAATAWSQRSGL